LRGGDNLQEDLFSIGRLSKITSISIDTIRYYNDIGLLKPAYISDESGYRYYSTEQVEILARIRELKTFGFSLNEIKRIPLQDDVSLTELYQSRYWSLLQEKEKLQNAVDKLSKKIKHQQEVRFMGKKVLLIDDSAFMRNICTEMLTKKGYEVVGDAEDGQQGLEKYKALQPDLVLLDIAMPEYDGKWALQKILEFDSNANIIMLSAVGHAQAVVDSFILGAKHFVVKPFQGDFLSEVMQNIFLDEAKPLNQIFLNHMSTTTHISGDKILSQDLINNILHHAQVASQPNITPSAELVEALKAIGTGEPKNFSVDETPALLRQIIQGQEKMTSLLERLVDKTA
jgi:two-component system chemotaxis response regulator CheY